MTSKKTAAKKTKVSTVGVYSFKTSESGLILLNGIIESRCKGVMPIFLKGDSFVFFMRAEGGGNSLSPLLHRLFRSRMHLSSFFALAVSTELSSFCGIHVIDLTKTNRFYNDMYWSGFCPVPSRF